MIAKFSRVLAAASVTLAVGASLVSGSARADSLNAGMDLSGVSSSTARSFNAFTDGARNRPRNPFVDGARIGNRDPFVDGARIGGRDVFGDGAHIGRRDVFSEGA